jgi:hypothetical protein
MKNESTPATTGRWGREKVPFKGLHEIRPNGATSSAALICTVRPTLDAKSVVNIIQRGCDDIGDKGYDIYTGYGLVNFGKSLTLAREWDESGESP